MKHIPTETKILDFFTSRRKEEIMSRQYFAINFYDNCDWLVIEEIPMCDFKTAVALHLKKQSIF